MIHLTTPTQRARTTQCKATTTAFASSTFTASVCFVEPGRRPESGVRGPGSFCRTSLTSLESFSHSHRKFRVATHDHETPDPGLRTPDYFLKGT
jgi:hypothetical protein